MTQIGPFELLLLLAAAFIAMGMMFTLRGDWRMRFAGSVIFVLVLVRLFQVAIVIRGFR